MTYIPKLTLISGDTPEVPDIYIDIELKTMKFGPTKPIQDIQTAVLITKGKEYSLNISPELDHLYSKIDDYSVLDTPRDFVLRLETDVSILEFDL